MTHAIGSSRKAGRLRDQPWFRSSEPHGGGAQPGTVRRAGDDPVALESLRALARAAEAAGRAGALRLRTWGPSIRPATVPPPTRWRHSSWPCRFMPRRWPSSTTRSETARAGDGCRALRRAGRSAGRRPPRGRSRLSDEQLHLGRYLRPLRPRGRRRGACNSSPICAHATARPRRHSGSSRP